MVEPRAVVHETVVYESRGTMSWSLSASVAPLMCVSTWWFLFIASDGISAFPVVPGRLLWK